MTAEVDDNPEVADMIHLLGKLLRYSVNTRGELVHLHDELSHLDTFMRIIEYRYPNRFRMVLSGDYEAVRSLRVVKLIFQPIVENAVLYGFDEQRGSAMTITITHELDQDNIVFRIRDNGVGMDADMLKQLQDSMDTPPGAGDRMRGSGIGLRNVNERIRLFYGEHYGIEIVSTAGIGTEVVIILPYRE
jgi:two-component system, sensor histidine kinase YesM